MAITSKQITQAGNPATQVFLSSGQNAITTMIICNTSTINAAIMDMYVVSSTSGLAVGPQTQILNSVSIPATESFVMAEEKFILEDQDSVYVRSSVAGALTVTVSTVSTA
jgi:hypothetical protein